MTNCPVYVVHLSTRLGLERIKQAQALGQRVYTETCPQYLLLTEDAMQQWGPLAKIGPPLRPAAGGDREALWAGLAQGSDRRGGQRPLAATEGDEGSQAGRTSSRMKGQRDSVRQSRRWRRWCRWSTPKAW